MLKQFVWAFGRALDAAFMQELEPVDRVAHFTAYAFQQLRMRVAPIGSEGGLTPQSKKLELYWCNSLKIMLPHKRFALTADGGWCGRRSTLDCGLVNHLNYFVVAAPQVCWGIRWKA